MTSRRRLIEKKKALVLEAVENIDDPKANIDERIQNIDNLDRLIRESGPNAATKFNEIFIGVLICAFVVGTLSVLPFGRNKLVVDSSSDSVVVQLGDQIWKWIDIPIQNYLLLENLSQLEIPTRETDEFPNILHGTPWVEVTGGTIQIQELLIGENALVDLQTIDDGTIVVSIKNAQVEGKYIVSGGATVSGGTKSQSEDYSYTAKREKVDVLRFTSSQNKTVPVVFRLQKKSDFKLPGAIIDALYFSKKVPINHSTTSPVDANFICTLHQGSVHFTDTNSSTEFRPGDCLTSSQFSGRIVSLAVADTLTLSVDGTASRLLVGPYGYQRNITPSSLEWISTNQSLTLWWGGMVFLGGLVWVIRKYVPR